MTIERTVRARWSGGLRAEMDAGGFPMVADEPTEVGGTGTGPQPTELLLASIASCFTLAMAYSAAKHGFTLAEDLEVTVTGYYNGPQFDSFRIAVHTSAPSGAELDKLIASAERVCYVTRTLRAAPQIKIVTE
jgi:organic hydroperoxide reductase OsmC/OhrA